MTAYYNEIDKFAAQWLRELIKAGLIADGEVDERSIEDVIPSELMGFTQCHFFAGIGGWSYALRLAGWHDDRPVWTGSCPCQPFSAAGKVGGTSDERHLWPSFEWLIRQCRPDVIFGEQVESAIKHDWLDHVALSLEGIGYAVGSVGFPACSVGAPHIRQRLYWVADSGLLRQTRSARQRNNHAESARVDGLRVGIEGRGPARRVADADRGRCENGWPESPSESWNSRYEDNGSKTTELCNAGVLGDSGEQGCERRLSWRQDSERGDKHRHAGCSGPTNGFWADAEWLPCRDGKARPVEPGTFPLAHGVPARVGRLRGYGNAIVTQAAAAFIMAYMETF